MAMIFHLIECLNGLGMNKIETKQIFAASTVIDHSPFLNLVHLNKVFKDKNYTDKLKVDLKKKYFEIRNDLANLRIDRLLTFIWNEIGVTMRDDSLYPFRNAMLVGFVDEQTRIYEEVIEKFCNQLCAARKARSHVCKESINEMVWPILMIEASLKHGGKGSSNLNPSDKLLMKKLAAVTKFAADEMEKKERREKAENALELD